MPASGEAMKAGDACACRPSMCPGKISTRSFCPGSPESPASPIDCRARRNGNTRCAPARDWCATAAYGAAGEAEQCLRLRQCRRRHAHRHERRTASLAATASPTRHPWVRSSRTPGVSTTWRETFGNGSRTAGTNPTTAAAVRRFGMDLGRLRSARRSRRIMVERCRKAPRRRPRLEPAGRPQPVDRLSRCKSAMTWRYWPDGLDREVN